MGARMGLCQTVTAYHNSDVQLYPKVCNTILTTMPSPSTSRWAEFKSALSPKPKPKRTVRFSGMDQLILVEYPTQELRRSWYSQSERDQLKVMLQLDAHQMAKKLATTPMDLSMCLGMEKLMTPEIALTVKQRKRDHVRDILAAQDCLDEDEMALFSEYNSRWTRMRAQELAAGHVGCMYQLESSP